jgi:hypothetical protein
MKKQVTLAAGDYTDEALAFLLAHGAKVESCLGLTVISLPETANVERGAHGWDYTIGWNDEEGDPEEEYIEVELYVDAYETVLRLKK